MSSSSGSSDSFATPNARTDAHVMEYRDRMPKHHRSMNAHTTASPWSFGNQVTRLVARAGRHPMTLSEALGVLRALDHLEDRRDSGRRSADDDTEACGAP